MNKYTVILTGKRKPVSVEAHYYTVTDHGVLMFKYANSPAYPTVLHTFASGSWREVIMVLP